MTERERCECGRPQSNVLHLMKRLDGYHPFQPADEPCASKHGGWIVDGVCVACIAGTGFPTAPLDAPAPLSREAGEAVKRIVDSMEAPDAQPEAGEEIVLHRYSEFVGTPSLGDWFVCPMRGSEKCHYDTHLAVVPAAALDAI